MPNWTTPCPNCPRKYRAIGGSGPQPAPVLCIAERPGKDENLRGRVLVGKTGQEWDELYLPLAGLDRSEVRVCNTVLCWAESNKTPSDKEILHCARHHIPDEIEKTNPDVIILMGSTACKLVPGIKLELHHGIPQPTSKVGKLLGWSGWMIPMYHPSIGLHESRWMQICMEDWSALKRYGFDTTLYEEDSAEETYDYQVARQIAFRTDQAVARIAVDTESHGGSPWSVQYSERPGMGRLVQVRDSEALSQLRGLLYCAEEVVLHNASYDLEVLRKLGIHIRSYRDTMQEAFHLGNLPQGLKALAYRLFRHTMTSYNETVRPASIEALQTWMIEALQIAQTDLCFTERVQLNTKVKEVVHKGELESLLDRLLRLTDVSSEYDPWERLHEFWNEPSNEWMVDYVTARVGHYPVLGIANCKLADAVNYACGDADWTGRVAVELARRRAGAFEIYKGDRD